MNDVERLDRNWEVLQHLVARSERLARRGRHQQAAVSAMTAATFAWCNPSGVFASDRLEDVLARLADTLPAAGRATPRPAGSRRRVLHVASQLYGTGGHTQMLANWLRLDTAREHHVCLTAQQEQPVPAKVTAVLGSTDALTLLDRPHRTLMDRAADLRRLASRHDHVVLHVHPNDVVAGIALSRPVEERPEVLLVNHADHVFWLGASLADRVVNLRLSGARLATERRGVPESRNALLVRPLHLRERELSRARAKADLGVDPGAVLVVTAADTYKYGAPAGHSLLDVLLPMLRDRPGVLLHAAGPSPDGDWSVLAEEGLGRAWGLLPDVRTLLEAADVYVDSYPFSSLTSMLEAASLDTPVLTLRTGDERLGVLGADTPELEDHLVVARTGDDLARKVARLLADDASREELGASTGAAVRRFHADGAWQDAVGTVFDTVLDAPAADVRAGTDRETGPLDQQLLRVMAHGVGQGLAGSLDVVAPVLPWPQRLTTAVRLARAGRLRPALLVPGAAARPLRRAREAVRRPVPRRA